jgi:hypothetical protein
MEFPSSAADKHAAFVAVNETLLPPSASIVETQEGYDVIENASAFKCGDTLLIWFCGRQQHAYWAGEALDDVRLVGVVTHTIRPVCSDENPFM